MTSMALTDHNSIAGYEELLRHSENAGVKPVFGAEVDVVPFVVSDTCKVQSSTVVLLIEQENGYRNLCRLLSGEKPGKQDILDLNSGLIILTGGISNELFSYISQSDKKAVESYLNSIVSTFGIERSFIEIHPPRDEEHKRINQRIIKLARAAKIPLVATNNVHYINPEEDVCYRFLKGESIPGDMTVKTYQDSISGGRTLHFISDEKMAATFEDIPHALSNTLDIAERCNLDVKELRRQRRLFSYERGRDPESSLWDLITQQIKRRYPSPTSTIRDRINQEFDYITQEGLAEFIIFLYQLKRWTREQNVITAIRAGSILSSIVAYVLEIVETDPIKFHFKFAGLKEKKNQLAEVTLEVSEQDHDHDD